MRVIAGSAKGVRLYAPSGMKTRPTADRVKEALFSILGSSYDYHDASVLDICAGTGALGIEALSRGAGRCCFIEQSRAVTAILARNLDQARLRERSEIIAVDALQGIRLACSKYRQFSLIFFDPPYESGLYDTVFPLLSAEHALADDGVLVVESGTKKVNGSMAADYFRETDHRSYGDTLLTFYMRKMTE